MLFLSRDSLHGVKNSEEHLRVYCGLRVVTQGSPSGFYNAYGERTIYLFTVTRPTRPQSTITTLIHAPNNELDVSEIKMLQNTRITSSRLARDMDVRPSLL
jgi:hypothetical protein